MQTFNLFFLCLPHNEDTKLYFCILGKILSADCSMWCEIQCVTRFRVMAILPYMGNTMCHGACGAWRDRGWWQYCHTWEIQCAMWCVTRSRVMAILSSMGNTMCHGAWCVRRSRVMAILPYMGNTMCHVVRDEIEGDGNIAIHGKYNVTWGLLCVTRSRVMAILPYMGNTMCHGAWRDRGWWQYCHTWEIHCVMGLVVCEEIEGGGNIAIHGKYTVSWGMWCVRRSRVVAILPYMGNTLCHGACGVWEDMLGIIMLCHTPAHLCIIPLHND